MSSMEVKDSPSPMPSSTNRLDLGAPRWDQSTFSGRFKHFLNITDMRLSMCGDKELEDAKALVTNYKLGLERPGTTEKAVMACAKGLHVSFLPKLRNNEQS